jgi:hypothetical protein
MKLILSVFALVLFIMAAIAALLIQPTDLRWGVGLTAAGLACAQAATMVG